MLKARWNSHLSMKKNHFTHHSSQNNFIMQVQANNRSTHNLGCSPVMLQRLVTGGSEKLALRIFPMKE